MNHDGVMGGGKWSGRARLIIACLLHCLACIIGFVGQLTQLEPWRPKMTAETKSEVLATAVFYLGPDLVKCHPQGVADRY